MKIINMSIPERAAISRRHNPFQKMGPTLLRDGLMTHDQMTELILDLYGLRKFGDDPSDLKFSVEDEKKYMMYLLRGLL